MEKGISKMLINCVNTFSREGYWCAKILKELVDHNFRCSLKNKETGLLLPKSTCRARQTVWHPTGS